LGLRLGQTTRIFLHMTKTEGYLVSLLFPQRTTNWWATPEFFQTIFVPSMYFFIIFIFILFKFFCHVCLFDNTPR